MTSVEQFCIGFFAVVFASGFLYVVFAPWLAQIDISKNTESIAKKLEEINETLKDLERSVERREE